MTLRQTLALFLSMAVSVAGALTTTAGASSAPADIKAHAEDANVGVRPKAPERGAGFRKGKEATGQRGVEVEGWTPTSHSITGADGTTRVKVYPRPTFQRAADGEWARLHARVRKVPKSRGARRGLAKNDVARVFSDGFSVVAGGGAVPVAFGTGGDRGLMQQALPGGVVTWHLDGMRPTSPVITSESRGETTVEYRDIFNGVDLRYRIRPAEVKEEFILAAPSSAKEFTFSVVDPNHLLGGIETDKSTDEVTFSGEVGEGLSMSLSPPIAWSEQGGHGSLSANPNRESTGPSQRVEEAYPGDGSATQSASRTPHGYRVKVALGEGFSDASDYPIVLDPTQSYSWSNNTLRVAWAPKSWSCDDIIECPPLADALGGVAYVYDNNASKAYIEANLGNLPPWIEIDSATLSFDMDPYSDATDEWGNGCYRPYVNGLERHMNVGDGWGDSPGTVESYPVSRDGDVVTVVHNRVSLDVTETLRRVQGEGADRVAFEVQANSYCIRAGRSVSVRSINSVERSLSDAAFEFTYSGEGIVLPPPIPVDQTWGCDCRWANGSNRVAHQADPVNTAAGALWERSVDASLGSVGIPILVGRTYNGQDSEDGLLGVGWSSDFETSVSQNPSSGAVVFRDATGGRTRFSALPAGGYLAPVGATSELSSLVGGGWKIKSSATGEELTFNSSGQILSDFDSNGRGVTYAYASGRLATVTDATGRSASLEYVISGDGMGKLESVDLPGGKTVTYEYDTYAGKPRLVAVVGLDGGATTFSYTVDGILDGIVDPSGSSAAESTYDSGGRLVSQVDPAGGTWTFKWHDYSAPGIPPGTGAQVTVAPDDTVTRNVYYGNTLVKQTVRPHPMAPGATTSYTYDSRQNLVAVRNPLGYVTTMTYDSAGRMLTRTAPSPVSTVESWTYDAQGRLVTSTNGAGETATNHYDAAGNLDWLENAEGERTLFEYNSLGLITEQTSPMGREITHTYDARGNRLSSTQPGGAKTAWTYDSRDRVVTEVSPRGNVSGAVPADFTTTYTYDSGDRIETVTAPNGNVSTHVYDLAGRQTALVIKDAMAATLSTASWTYDNAGNQLTATANGRTTTNTYYLGGSLATTTDPVGLRTTYWWESDRLTGSYSSNADESEWYVSEYFTYDLAGQKTRSSSNMSGQWNQSETVLEYDAAGRVMKSSKLTGYDTNNDSEWAETTYTHDDAGRVTKTIDPDGGESLSGYDDAGRVVSSKAPGRPAALSTYNDDGLLISSTAPGGGITTYTYTPAGQVATVTDPKGNVPGAVAAEHRVTTTYDVEGNLLTTTDQLGNTITNSYDNLSRLATKTNALNKTTSYAYDAASNLVKVTAPPTSGTGGGAETDYAYNVHGELTKRTDELGRETIYTRDPDSGRTTAITDPLNRVKEFTYDAAGRLTEWANPSGSTVAQTFTPGGLLVAQSPSTGVGSVRHYNEAGLITRITDTNDTQSTDLTYNRRGLLTGVDGPDGVFEYTYAADGNVASRTYPDGTVVEYDHDNDGLPVEQQVTQGSSTDTITYDYDPAGLLIETTYPTSTGGGGPPMVQARTYDNVGRITSVTNTGPGVGGQGSLATTYTRDDAGQPIAISEKRGTGPSATTRHTGYAYTGQGWIARECEYGATAPTALCTAASTPLVTYGYDAVGNQTALTKTGPSGVTTETQVSTYDAADQLATATTTLGTGTPSTKDYSYNANGELATGGRTYDALGRITGKNNPAGSGQITYTYNPQGQRIKMTRTGANAGTQELVWDTNNALPLIAQTDNTGDDLGAGGGAQTHLWTPQGLPLATQPDSGEALWYTHDALGSVTDITTDTGTPVTSARYSLFGEPTLTDNQATPATVPVNPGFGYTSGFNQLGDPELHLRARDYDPTMRAFTAPDPLAPDTGAPAISTYHYGNNSPLVYIDPTGEWPQWVEDAVDWGAEKVNALVSNPGSARTDFSAGAIRGAGDTADLILNCSSASRLPNTTCDDYLGGGGYTPGKSVSDWVNVRTGADTQSLAYICGVLFGVPGAGAAGTGTRAGAQVVKRTAPAALAANGASGLSDDVVGLATRNITNSGDTVLGHFPGYITKANSKGASYFDIGDAWNGLTPSQRWAANTHFLDTRIAAGDRVLLSVPKGDIRPGSYLAQEVQYLTSNGYRWTNQWSLLPRG